MNHPLTREWDAAGRRNKKKKKGKKKVPRVVGEISSS